MGKTKPFIDKKNAKTFSLVFRPGGSEDAYEGTASEAPPSVVPSRRGAAGGDDDFFDEELAYLMGGNFSIYEDEDYELTEERRREIVSLGLPDDGYDYLKHLRALGPSKPEGARGTSRASTSAAAPFPDEDAPVGGPSVFIQAPKFQAPKDDVRMVDARQLSVAPRHADHHEDDDANDHEAPDARFSDAEDDDVDDAEVAAAVRAFARPADLAASTRRKKGRLQQEVEEIEQCMADLEADEEANQLGDEEGGGDWGDWLDEFVVVAAKEGEEQQQQGGAQAAQGPQGRAYEEEEEEEGEEEEAGAEGSVDAEDEDGDEELEHAAARAGAGKAASHSGRSAHGGDGYAKSIASSYWRAERNDRKAGFEDIDATFDKLATQYEDDELGELEDGSSAAAAARGGADIAAYAHLLDDFLAEQKQLMAEQGQHDDGDDDGNGYPDHPPSAANDLTAEGLRRLAPGAAGGNKVQTLENVDREVIALTKARIAAKIAAAAAGASGDADVDADEAIDVFNAEPRTTLVMDRDQRWDCESVLSLRSNLENHPGRIVEPQRRSGTVGGGTIKLSAKTGIPTVTTSTALTAKAVAGMSAATVTPRVGVDPRAPGGAAAQQHSVRGGDGDDVDSDGEGSSGDDAGSDEQQGAGAAGCGASIAPSYLVGVPRRKGESAEEKKARKAAVKDARRGARAAKKELKGMFKEEAGKQRKQAAGKGAAGGSTFVIP